MEVQELPAALDFANTILDIAYKEDYDLDATMNGLAVATAAALVDSAISSDVKLDEAELAECLEKFIENLKTATAFTAKTVLEQER